MDETLKQKLVDACIRGVHASQLRLFYGGRELSSDGTPGGFVVTGLGELETALENISSADSQRIAAWMSNGKSDEHGIGSAVDLLNDAPLTLSHVLPVTSLVRYLKSHSPSDDPAGPLSVANLHQAVLEVDRDATLVQSLFRLYVDLGIPVSLEELGVADDAAGLDKIAAALSQQVCACPYDTSAEAWRLAFEKVKNWGEQFRGVFTAETYAAELMALPEIGECEDAIKAMPAQSICILGHSFTQSMHWSTHASFTDITASIFAQWNPAIRVAHVSGNHLSSTGAVQDRLEQVLAHQPDRTLVVVVVREDEHIEALEEIIRRLRAAGSEVNVFDSIVFGFGSEQSAWAPEVSKRARQAGAGVVAVKEMLAAHPQRDDFEALDVVHMTPVYHKVMAIEWTRFLCGMRSEER
jgi:hypothetical protein